VHKDFCSNTATGVAQKGKVLKPYNVIYHDIKEYYTAMPVNILELNVTMWIDWIDFRNTILREGNQ
jgi:hypothetical protein